MGHAGEGRDRGEEDRDRPAEADPRDEELLVAGVSEGRQRQPDGERPGDEGQGEGDEDAGPGVVDEGRGHDEQAEDEEHHDLAEPGRGVMEADDGGVGARRAVGDDEPGDEDRKEPAAAGYRGEAVDEDRARHGEERVQPARHRDVVEHRDEGEAAGDAEGRADRHLLDHEERELPRGGAVAGDDELGQDHRHQHGEGIVGAGLDLEGGADPALQAQAAGADQEEHRRRVGRGDDRAEEERLGRARSR